jgi:hypothetical protein
MTGPEYRASLARLRLTHAAAAAVLRVSERQSQRYGSGASEVPPGVAETLRWMEAQRLTTHEMLEGFGVRDRISVRSWNYAAEP